MSVVNGLVQGVNLGRAIHSDIQQGELHERRKKMLDNEISNQARAQRLADALDPLTIESARRRNNFEQATLPVQQQEIIDAAEYQKKVRPLALEQQEQALAHQKKMMPVEMETAKNQNAASRLSLSAEQMRQQQMLEAKRLKEVEQMAGAEYARVNAGGRFSNHFLNISANTLLSPFNYDADMVDALREAKQYLDPRNPNKDPFSDPKVLPVFNKVLKSELNNGGTNPHTGLPIIDKMITAIFPAKDAQGKNIPGKVFLGLKMTDEGGNTYEAPLTENRSSDPNDKIKAVDVSQVVQRVNAQTLYANMVQKNPTAHQMVMQRAKEMSQGRIAADETPWQGRTVKTSELFEMFKHSAQYGDPENRRAFVTYSDFEWTQGDPVKLEILERAARYNRQLVEKLDRLDADPEEKAKIENQEWMHPHEIYQEVMRSQKESGKYSGLVQSITQAQPAAPQAPAPAAKPQTPPAPTSGRPITRADVEKAGL